MLTIGLVVFGLVIVLAVVALIVIVSTPGLMDGWNWVDLLFFWLDWLD
jgi:hypothetical protein